MAAGARWLTAVAAISVLLAAADTYVVVLALTSIIGDVGIPIDRLQQAAPIVSGFLLGYVAVLPLLGRLSDVYGRRPVFLGCLTVFALGSMITGSGHDLTVVVTGRTLQGLGGGGLVPVTLALVADLWPRGGRGVPLGAVGAAQEIGSVLGPLYGALIITVSTWRTIFWINVPLVVIIGAAFMVLHRRVVRSDGGAVRDGRFDIVAGLLVGIGALAMVAAIIAPAALVDDDTTGSLFIPLAGRGWWITAPIWVIAVSMLIAVLARSAWPSRATRPLIPIRGLPELARRADWLGALLLAGCLGMVVIAFAAADPSVRALSPEAWLLLPMAFVFGALFLLRERRCRDPLIPLAALSDRAAWGALLTNMAIGAALIAALVDIPILARETAFPGSQIGAAFVLLRLLITVPPGALLGGLLCERVGYRMTTAAGMLLSAAMFAVMTRWTATTLTEPLLGVGWLHSSDLVLGACGLGFGAAIAPVNASMLGAVRSSLHGMASALVVVARSVGMLVGLSLLTVIGLRSFYAAASALPSPLRLCPETPTRCPAYDTLVTGAVVGELHTIFLGAALCAAAAALVAAATLRRRGDAPRHSGR
ncbi:MAG: MFS transporter [Candidatus Dormibacteria bacterium]